MYLPYDATLSDDPRATMVKNWKSERRHLVESRATLARSRSSTRSRTSGCSPISRRKIDGSSGASFVVSMSVSLLATWLLQELHVVDAEVIVLVAEQHVGHEGDRRHVDPPARHRVRPVGLLQVVELDGDLRPVFSGLEGRAKLAIVADRAAPKDDHVLLAVPLGGESDGLELRQVAARHPRADVGVRPRGRAALAEVAPESETVLRSLLAAGRQLQRARVQRRADLVLVELALPVARKLVRDAAVLEVGDDQ